MCVVRTNHYLMSKTQGANLKPYNSTTILTTVNLSANTLLNNSVA